MSGITVARWCWWITTGLCAGMALCGLAYEDSAYLVGGAVGTWWFSTLCLLPDSVFWKREGNL